MTDEAGKPGWLSRLVSGDALTALAQELEAARAANEELRGHLEVEAAARHGALAENAALTGQLSELIRALAEERQRANEHAADLVGRLDELSKRLASETSRCERIDRERAACEVRANKCDVELARMSRSLGSTRAELAAVLDRAKQLTAERDAAREGAERDAVRLAETEAELASAVEALAAAETAKHRFDEAAREASARAERRAAREAAALATARAGSDELAALLLSTLRALGRCVGRRSAALLALEIPATAAATTLGQLEARDAEGAEQLRRALALRQSASQSAR